MRPALQRQRDDASAGTVLRCELPPTTMTAIVDVLTCPPRLSRLADTAALRLPVEAAIRACPTADVRIYASRVASMENASGERRVSTRMPWTPRTYRASRP